MQIYIDGKLAVLKKNTSFEYVSENALFTGSDSYSLSITFPLKDCENNMAIFGWITRKDVDKERIVMDCYMRDEGFFRSGVLTVTEITDIEVKGQFLEGRSEANFNDSFDEIYINRLSFGYPNVQDRNPGNVTPSAAWAPYPQNNEVALPWVNNTSGNIQNEAKYENGSWRWNWSQDLTFQPYLIYILKKIFTSLGYEYDFSEIEYSEMRYLVICNAVPAAWELYDYAYALPHWSLTEFLEEVEKLLFGEFSINHRSRKIAFHFNKAVQNSTDPVEIKTIVNAYTTNINRDKNCDYVGLKNIKYADNDNRYWPYRSCQWYIREHGSEAVHFDTLNQLLQYAQTLKESGVYEGGSRTGDLYCRGYRQGSDGHKLFFAEDVQQYFIMFCYDATQVKTTTVRDKEYHWYKYDNRLELINQFGAIEVEKDAEDEELNIVPAWIDDTDEEHGQMIFLECGEMGSVAILEEDTQSGTGQHTITQTSGTFGVGNMESQNNPTSGIGARTGTPIVDETDYNDGALAQGKTGKAIERGEQDKSEEYFDRIYIGYWDGTNRITGKTPYPFTHTLITTNEFTKINFPYSLSLRRETGYYGRMNIPEIDGKKKYNFSWIGDEIPDAKAVFYIFGKKYLCEKITTQFTENGRSQLLKGVFYRII